MKRTLETGSSYWGKVGMNAREADKIVNTRRFDLVAGKFGGRF